MLDPKKAILPSVTAAAFPEPVFLSFLLSVVLYKIYDSLIEIAILHQEISNKNQKLQQF